MASIINNDNNQHQWHGVINISVASIIANGWLIIINNGVSMAKCINGGMA
jgi:hypothetical protein